jgi:isochorismate synthase
MAAVAFDRTGLLTSLDERLRSILAGCSIRHEGLLSLTLSVPELMCLSGLHGLGAQTLYWSRPALQQLRLGWGCAAVIQTQGSDRFVQLDRELARIRETWLQLDPEGLGIPPRAFFGFSFATAGTTAGGFWHGLPDACLRVPELLLERQGSSCVLTFSCRGARLADRAGLRRAWLSQVAALTQGFSTAPDRSVARRPLVRIACAPEKGIWLGHVERARRAIRDGRLAKVVLSRRVRVTSEPALCPGQVLGWLAEHHPGCTVYGVAAPGGWLIGASPERLVALEDRKLACDAVAATGERATDPDQDRRLGGALLCSEKARREQRIVVEDIVRALEPLGFALQVPDRPRLLQLSGLQHLWSPIRGRVAGEISLLRVVSRLHPTPAVGGTPREAALAWLAEHTPDCERGWYTGALGWITADGEGDLTVILRCALVTDHCADLYAGAGIVADSDPETEFAETEWKLRTMLDALAAP